MSKTKNEYRKLRRGEAIMLANYVRENKLMELSQGWYTFYRFTPDEITKRYPVLSLDVIVKGARLESQEDDLKAI